MKSSILALAATLLLTVVGDAATLRAENLTLCDAKEAKYRLICGVYVTAFVEGVEFSQHARDIGHAICIPPTVLDEQARRVIENFAKKAPEWEPAPDVATQALIAAYPCKKSN